MNDDGNEERKTEHDAVGPLQTTTKRVNQFGLINVEWIDEDEIPRRRLHQAIMDEWLRRRG